MKKLFNRMDKPLLIMTIIYLILGLVMIFSASSVAAVLRYKVSPYYYFIKQVVFILVTLFVSFAFIIKFPTKNYKPLIRIGLLVILGSLIGLFIYGSIVNSAKSWYDLGLFNVQPSEFAKTILIIYFAVYFSNPNVIKNPNSFIKPLIIAGLIVILVAMQPDLGSAFVIAGLAFLLFISIPLGKSKIVKALKNVALLMAIFLAGFLYFGNNLLNQNQLARLNFKNPCSRYTQNTGYQVCNSLIAVSNGGLFGKGLGDSSQKYLYLPESHTDFIFPIIVEELGSLFGVLVIVGYAYILYRILKIAKKSVTLRGSILAYGVFIYFTLHILINLLGIFAIIPLTGIPLPFLSYGGSYTCNIIICVFIVQRVAIETKIYNSKNQIN